MLEVLEQYGAAIGALGTFGTVLVLAWKHGGFVAWVKATFSHVDQTLTRIERSNEKQHDRIHERIDELEGKS